MTEFNPIKNLMKIYGLNQTKLSEKIGFSPSVVSKWKDLGLEMSARSAVEICERLGIEMWEFYCPAEIRASFSDKIKFEADEIELMRLYRKFKSKESKKLAYNLISTLLESSESKDNASM